MNLKRYTHFRPIMSEDSKTAELAVYILRYHMYYPMNMIALSMEFKSMPLYGTAALSFYLSRFQSSLV